MTYGEKYKEVFGYYPEEIPCPDECPKEYENRLCEGCKYFNLSTQTTFRKVEEDTKNEEKVEEDTKNEEKEADRQSDRRNLSSIDIYNYLRTANPSEYGVIYSIAAYKMSESLSFKDFLTLVFANLFAVSDKFDAEVMYKAQQMILKHYGEEG